MRCPPRIPSVGAAGLPAYVVKESVQQRDRRCSITDDVARRDEECAVATLGCHYAASDETLVRLVHLQFLPVEPRLERVVYVRSIQ